MPRVSSAAERYRYLRELRPDIQLPEQITVFTWPRQAEAMRELGIWQRIEDRLVRLGGADLARACEEALNALVVAERAEVVAVIRGGGASRRCGSGTPPSDHERRPPARYPARSVAVTPARRSVAVR